ncbi:ATP-binding protein [Streptomyces aurantiacus]|uniref:ATP-binding protein n=1 Tax=Streptomyces aurantiacus TaxID=47760 RepID=A0A7G1P0L6_9ACTN|nr:ATP-binding protein [Streptomyces aurantiacus]BCL28789.1 ATP-binding protein [Streptomyces aurantiacus]
MQVLQVQLEIRPDPTEVGRARRWARSRLAGSGIEADEPLSETLILLVSELVTNAVVHTGRPAVLRLSMPDAAPEPPVGESSVGEPSVGERAVGDPSVGEPVVGERAVGGRSVGGRAGDEAVATVRLEVLDTSTRAPRPRCADGDETNGRGLALVDCLADRWGWSPEGAGKRIWCEVDRCSSAAVVDETCDAAPAAYGDLTYEAV